MSRPLVAIVGRPNVGKSMLFNKLCGRRLSIVEDTPGVTRDRLYAECEWCGRTFDIVDTGGIEPSTDNEILLFMREQAQLAIDAADVVVLVTEIGTGVTAADQEVANMLLRSKKPVVLAVNKMDSTGVVDPGIYEFYSLGLGDPIAVSAVHATARATCSMPAWSISRPRMRTMRTRTTPASPSSASRTSASPRS